MDLGATGSSTMMYDPGYEDPDQEDGASDDDELEPQVAESERMSSLPQPSIPRLTHAHTPTPTPPITSSRSRTPAATTTRQRLTNSGPSIGRGRRSVLDVVTDLNTQLENTTNRIISSFMSDLGNEGRKRKAELLNAEARSMRRIQRIESNVERRHRKSMEMPQRLHQATNSVLRYAARAYDESNATPAHASADNDDNRLIYFVMFVMSCLDRLNMCLRYGHKCLMVCCILKR